MRTFGYITAWVIVIAACGTVLFGLLSGYARYDEMREACHAKGGIMNGNNRCIQEIKL
jgi:hypothetical protein